MWYNSGMNMKKSVILLALAAMGAFADAVTWDFPRTGSCHEGIPFADGTTGVLVWGGDDAINLTVGRADLWDHRGGYPWTAAQSYTNIVAALKSNDEQRLLSLFKKDTPAGEPRNPYMLPLGRVVVRMQGWKLVSGALDPKTGLGELLVSNGEKTLPVKMAMSMKSRVFAMKFPDEVAYAADTMHCMDFPEARKALARVGIEPAVKTRANIATDSKGEIFALPKGKSAEDGLTSVGETGGFDWDLPADQSVALRWMSVGPELRVSTSRSDNPEYPRAEYSRVRGESLDYWTEWWSKSARIDVPDETVQRVFDYGMYRFGAMTDPDGVPAGLQGPWLEDDRLVPWNGDYHFNINVQECYSPAYRGGHFENLMPLFRMVLSWRPRLRDNARRFCGIDDGYVLPHSVDDRGVCIGGFWTGTIDHASTAWVAAMMMKYVRYSGDVKFLREDAYDFMKGAMRVYREMMEETADGKLAIPIGPSPEWGGSGFREAVGRNPSFQLAAAHRLARDLIDAAQLLGEEPDRTWLDVESRLPLYTKAGRGIGLFENREFNGSHRHHSHMAGYYPFDVLPVEGDVYGQLAWDTYSNWTFRGTGCWTGWCVPWASILWTHVGSSAAAVGRLHDWARYFCNPGHASLHDAYDPGFTVFLPKRAFGDGKHGTVMQMDGQCAAATAAMELLVHEVGGKTEFFRGCSESWREVSFENIALSDGRRASGKRVGGKTTITYSR